MSVQKKYLFVGILLFCLAGVAGFYLKGSAGESEGEVSIDWLYPPNYYNGNEFADGRAWVQEKEDGPWTLLDDKGNVLKTGFEASAVDRYQDGIASFLPPLLPDGRVWSWEPGFLDLSGDMVLAPGVHSGINGWYCEGLIAREDENGLYGFIDLNGKWVVPAAYDFQFLFFREGLALVQKGGKEGFIDKKGAVVIDFKFEDAYPFFHKMAAVRKDSKWGVIDPTGRWIAEPIYEKVYGPYWSNPIGLEKDGKVGFVDRNGDVVIDFQFLPKTDDTDFFVYCFNKGRASVILDDSDGDHIEYGIIDESGKILFRRKNCVFILRGDYILCMNENGQNSLIDREGGEHNLPAHFKFPAIWLAPEENNIHTFKGVTDEYKTGYFTISVNPDRGR